MTSAVALPLLQGAAFIFSLLVAIGPQNAFVLRQGLKRERVFTVALVSSVCDMVLITAGVAGFGAVVSRSPTLTLAAAWGGALFLLWYATRAFRSAMRPNSLVLGADPQAMTDVRAIVLSTLAFSLLNPHVWLDTVVLFGGMAAQQPIDQRLPFAIGGVCASFLWFFGLAYGARGLARVFERPAAWRVLDSLVGLLCLWLAFGLIRGSLH